MKDIKGYEGLYAVTEDGKVWSHKRKKFLVPIDNGRGYLVVNLSIKGIQKHFYVHRLVATAFISNPANLPHINHKDENPLNNNIDNLEWCTPDYNNKYGNHTVRSITKLKRAVYCIELDKKFTSISEAATELKLSKGNISNCLKGRIQTVGGYHWKYL